MLKKVIPFLLNKYILSIFISLIIIYFIPDSFSKYKVDLISDGYQKNAQFYFEDLDSDGSSEKIVYYINNIGNACYMIYDVNGNLNDQYNFPTQILDEKSKSIWFHDLNDNGFKEIYTLTRSQDSIFLNIHEPLINNGIFKPGIFVDMATKFTGEFDISTAGNTLIDRGTNDFIFAIKSGHSGLLRNIYKYRLEINKLIKSPHLTNNASISEIIDLDNNNKKEILLNVYASGNDIDSIFSNRSDYSSWLTVLNNDLTFKFKPIEFKSKFSALNITSINYNDIPHILSIYKKKNGENEFLIFNINGQLQKKQKIRSGNCKLIKVAGDSGFFLQYYHLGIIDKYDRNLNITNQYSIPKNSYINYINTDNNSGKEWVLTSEENSEVTIFSDDFKHELIFELPMQNQELSRVEYFKIGDESHFFIQRGNNYVIYKYNINPINNFQYLIYLGIIFMVLLLVTLAIKGQKIQEAKKRIIEQKISDLQLKSIKNQVDPHFVFNAVNTISEMTLMDNKLEADQFIIEFSGFMRKTLNRSDKIASSIKNELDYVSNYLRLQKIRLNNAFVFEIYIDKNVKNTQLIPKHTIYTYVENAVKYGIHNRKDQPKIKIDITQDEKQIVITVLDNGGGITDQLGSPFSTGNGIRILNSIFNLYSKRYKTKINHSLENYLGENGEIIGVKAEVKIRHKN